MFYSISIYYKLIKLFNATPKDLAQSSLHRIFKKKQEILISYVHYILVTYLQCLTKYKL